MLTRLDGEEGIVLANTAALGFGNLSDPQDFVRKLQSMASGEATVAKPLVTPDVIKGQGFKFVTTPAKKVSA